LEAFDSTELKYYEGQSADHIDHIDHASRKSKQKQTVDRQANVIGLRSRPITSITLAENMQ
jgi:hypothetical protein